MDRVPFGDLIYDTNVRFDHRYLKPKVDFRFIKLLIISTFRIILISKYFKKYNVNKVVTGEENYSFNGGIALRLSIFRKIPNLYLEEQVTRNLKFKLMINKNYI